MKTVLLALLIISSIAIIIAVLLQESKSDGVASISGETNIGGQGGKTTKNTYINRVVVVSGIVFFISALAIAAIY